MTILQTDNTYQQYSSSSRRWDTGLIRSYNIYSNRITRSSLNWRNNCLIYRNSYKTLIGKKVCCIKSISFCLIKHDDGSINCVINEKVDIL